MHTFLFVLPVYFSEFKASEKEFTKLMTTCVTAVVDKC